MATIPIKNPYDPDGKSWKKLHKVSGQVSNEDYLFFKTLFPADGTINATVATLFKGLIDELRERNERAKLETAWHLESDTYHLLVVLVQRRSTGRAVGKDAPRDDAGRTSGVHKAYGDAEKQRPVSKGSVEKRRRGKESE